MTAPNGFQVEPTQIRQHATTVSNLAGNLSSVASGMPDSLGGGAALGSFVQFLAAGLGTAMAKTGESLGHASSAVNSVSTALTRAADSYEQTDQDHIDRLRREAK